MVNLGEMCGQLLGDSKSTNLLGGEDALIFPSGSIAGTAILSMADTVVCGMVRAIEYLRLGGRIYEDHAPLLKGSC